MTSMAKCSSKVIDSFSLQYIIISKNLIKIMSLSLLSIWKSISARSLRLQSTPFLNEIILFHTQTNCPILLCRRHVRWNCTTVSVSQIWPRFQFIELWIQYVQIGNVGAKRTFFPRFTVKFVRFLENLRNFLLYINAWKFLGVEMKRK